MNLSIGIVGLPNVGKSTLFNALLKKQTALVANYPFATIEPNVGVVPVPDERLQKLAEIVALESTGPVARHPHPTSSHSLRALDDGHSLAPPAVLNLPPIISATVSFVDIAGLVKGAAQGQGLGNKFLSHIRETHAIAHVVRAFTEENIIREGSSDPQNDYAVIQTELILSDLQSAQSQLVKTKNPLEKALLARVIENLNSGIPVRDIKLSSEEEEMVKQMFFITKKPEIVVLNTSEEDGVGTKEDILKKRYSDLLQISQNKIIVVCAKIEEELSALSEDEQKEYLSSLGLSESGLERLIKKAYETLGLISFLTAGVKEVKAWTIKKGSTAVEAAGEIHTDFMKKFIKAEVVLFEDFVDPDGCGGPARNDFASLSCVPGGWKGAREKGKARLEGKDYIVNDGDVIEFKIGS